MLWLKAHFAGKLILAEAVKMKGLLRFYSAVAEKMAI